VTIRQNKGQPEVRNTQKITSDFTAVFLTQDCVSSSLRTQGVRGVVTSLLAPKIFAEKSEVIFGIPNLST